MSTAPFRQAEAESFRLKGQLSIEHITRAQFDAALANLRVQDAQGRYWNREAIPINRPGWLCILRTTRKPAITAPRRQGINSITDACESEEPLKIKSNPLSKGASNRRVPLRASPARSTAGTSAFFPL